MFFQYAVQHGQAYCLGLGKCCTGYDAGAFNQAACATAWTTTGWEYTLPANAAVYSRGNLTLNANAGAACIAALQGFACTPPSGAPLTTAAASMMEAATLVGEFKGAHMLLTSWMTGLM